jgi:hypothetical protein
VIVDLDGDTFQVREKAIKELEKLGQAAVPAVRQALEQNPTPGVRRRLEAFLSQPASLVLAPERLRRLRAIQVLEQAATSEARRLVADLANGSASALETQAAKAALERLAKRPAAGP